MHAILSDIGLSLWRLLPANPIVVRVVNTGSKCLQHLGMRTGYLGVLFVVVLISQLLHSGQGSTLSELAKGSSQVFMMVSVLQLGLVCLLAPVFAAGAISQEKDAETFNVLLTTPLTNAQIVLGSLAARMFFVVALLIAGLPIFGITMLFGGVTADQILLSFGIAACTAIVFGSMAILISVMRLGTRGTILWFYMGIALYLMVGFALGRFTWTYVPESVVPGVSNGMTWLAMVHPFWALMVALSQIRAPLPAAVAGYGWPLSRMLASPHTAYMAIALLTSLVMVTLATLFVRSGVRQGEASFWQRLRKRLRFASAASATAAVRRRPRRVWANPVAWREAVTRASAASSNLSRYSYLTVSIGAGLVFWYAYGTGVFANVNVARQWLVWIVMTEIMVVLLMAATTAATAITRERDDGTMELLLSTPLTSRYIIWGKLRGLVSFAVPLMAVPVGTVLAVSGYDLFRGGTSPPVVSLGRALMMPALLTVYTAFVCVAGLQMSLKSRRSVQAVLTAVGLLMVIAFGLGMCAYAATGLDDEATALLAPLTFVTSLIFLLDPGQFSRQVGRLGGVVPTSLASYMLVGTIIAVLVYGGIVVAMCRSMVTKFDMIIRKQSE